MTKKNLSATSNSKSQISKPQSLKVLIVEDSEEDALLEIRELEKGGYNPVYERVETVAAMKKSIQEKQWDFILCDYKLRKFNTSSAISLLKEINIDIPVIIVSGAIGEETVAECMRSGARDCIMKKNLSRLCPAIARELEETDSQIKRKQAEEALRESEALYRLLANNVTDTIWLLDMNLNFTYNTPSVAKKRGYTDEEIKQIPPDKHMTPESFNRAMTAFSEEMAKVKADPSYSFERVLELEIYRKDGTTFWSEITFTLIRDENGIPRSILGEGRDITERMQIEEALRESEEKYRSIIENMQEGYFEDDLAGNCTFVNNAMCKRFGYSKEEFTGMNYRQFQDETTAKKTYQAYNRIYRTGEPVKGIEIEYTRKDGIKGFAEVSVSLMRDAEGKPIGFRGISHDITERKQVEDTLRLSEEKYRILVEGSNDIIFSLDENFKFLSVNSAIFHHLKIKPEEIRSKYFFDLIYESNDRVSVLKQLVQEKLELFAMDRNPISFKIDFKVSFTSEPKEMRIYLEYVNIEGRNEIIGKATRVEDDLLLKYVESEKQHLIIENYFITAEDISHRITRNLAKHMDHKKVYILRIALREIIINAIEHGNFHISFEEKGQLIDNDNYFSFMAERQQDPKYKNRRVQIIYSMDSQKVTYQIIDQGDGFDHKKILLGESANVKGKLLGHGRGISMAKNCFDEVNYNDKGNDVMLIKYLYPLKT